MRQSRLNQQPASESVLVAQVLQYLNYRGHYAYRQNTGGARSSYTDKFGRTSFRFIRFGHPGISDIIGIASDGRFLAVECKHGYKKPTEDQLRFINEIRKRGGIAIIAYSLSDVEKVL